MWTVYILASKRNGSLYVWVTSDLYRRVYQHKQWSYSSFTKDHWIHQLVRYQKFSDITRAIEYEKKIKWKSRSYKMQLIEENNLHWFDLAKGWYE